MTTSEQKQISSKPQQNGQGTLPGAESPWPPPPCETDPSLMLAKLLERKGTLASIADECSLTLAQLGLRMTEPATAAALEGLLRASDIRTHMFIEHFRMNAIGSLALMASNQQLSELARKAAVDLLTINPGEVRALNAARTLAALGDHANHAGHPHAQRTGRMLSLEDIQRAFDAADDEVDVDRNQT